MNYKLTGKKFTPATKLEDIIDFMKLQNIIKRRKHPNSKRERERTTKAAIVQTRKENKAAAAAFQEKEKDGRGKPSYGKPHSNKVYNQEGQKMCANHAFSHPRDH